MEKVKKKRKGNQKGLIRQRGMGWIGKYKGKLLGEYRSLKDFQLHPVTEALFEELAGKLMKWADFDGSNDKDGKKKESYRFIDFLDEQGIEELYFDQWKAEYEPLKKAHAYAIRRLASRREHGAATGRYKPEVIKWTACLYDEDVRKGLEMLAKLQDLPSQAEAAVGKVLQVIDMAKMELEKNRQGKE